MASSSMMPSGSGLGTTRRHPRPTSSAIAHPWRAARPRAGRFVHERADRLGGMGERRAIRRDLDLRDHVVPGLNDVRDVMAGVASDITAILSTSEGR